MKRLLIIALAAAAFAACSKDSGNDGPKMPAKQAPYILYYDAATQTLAAGQWGTVNFDNMLHFKFGSVVGFTTPRVNSTWSSQSVKFDPSEGSYANYGNIPYCDLDVEGDGDISGIYYHNPENIKAGLGDPCKLVGLKANATLEQIAAHDSGLRLPTRAYIVETYTTENFTNTTEPVVGRWLTPGNVSTFLPAIYGRNPSGVPYNAMHGDYWTSRAYLREETEGLVQWASSLSFDNETVGTSGWKRECGFPIRCIHDTPENDWV